MTFYLTDGMKYLIIILTAICVSIILTRLLLGGNVSDGRNDYQEAKQMCSGRVSHFVYHYSFSTGLTEPDIVCK